MLDLFGTKARRSLERQTEALLRLETALEKATLELRLFRSLSKLDPAAQEERHTITKRKQTIDEGYLRVLAYLFVADENVKIALDKGTFYNIRALYPPLHADNDSIEDFLVSLRRHVFG